MDAKALLEGMGWREGQGLGKSNQGISEAIKPKVQLDRNGLGLNPAASLIEPWWAKVFNQTAKNVSVEDSPDSAVQKKKRKSELPRTENVADASLEHSEDSKKKKKKKRKINEAAEPEPYGEAKGAFVKESESVNAHIASVTKSIYLGSFTKGATLTPGESVTLENIFDDSKATVCDNRHVNPIDEELWKTCRGRTAHKGARYGVLKGKMARLVRQEQAMASKFCDKNS